MIKNPGLDNILNYLQNEHDRFLRAAESNMFCDTENCYKTAMIIAQTIDNLLQNREKLNF